MANWLFAGTIEPTTEWQFSSFATGSWFKVEQVNPPNSIGLEICQYDDSLLYVETTLLQSDHANQILCLPCPGPINDDRRIGFKIPGQNLIPDWSINLYSTDTPMPLFRVAPTVPLSAQSTTATPTVVTSSVASGQPTNTQLLAVNAGRKGAIITNTAVAAKLYVQMGANASASSFIVALEAGDTYEVPFGFTGLINGLWTASTGTAQVSELT